MTRIGLFLLFFFLFLGGGVGGVVFVLFVGCGLFVCLFFVFVCLVGFFFFFFGGGDLYLFVLGCYCCSAPSPAVTSGDQADVCHCGFESHGLRKVSKLVSY